MGGWWRWALLSPDGVAPSRMDGVYASVYLPLHHKVQEFSSGIGSPRWSRKKGHKMVSVCVMLHVVCQHSTVMQNDAAVPSEVLDLCYNERTAHQAIIIAWKTRDSRFLTRKILTKFQWDFHQIQVW